MDNNFAILSGLYIFVHKFRDVAQHGLEYSSGGRGVASSNLAIPTNYETDQPENLVGFFCVRGVESLLS